MDDRIAEARKIAEAVCAIAYKDGKTDGVYAAALDILAPRLELPQRAINDALLVGRNRGWIRRFVGHIELTAAGLYVAKRWLKLPT